MKKFSPTNIGFYMVFRRIFRMPTDNNMNVAKTPIFQRFYEKCSLAVQEHNRVRLFQKSSEISAFSVVNKFPVVFLE